MSLKYEPASVPLHISTPSVWQGKGLEHLELLGGATPEQIFRSLDTDNSNFVDEAELVNAHKMAPRTGSG